MSSDRTRSDSFVEDRVERQTYRVRRGKHHHVERAYRWPYVMLFVVLAIIFVCAAVTLGGYAYLDYVQHRLMVTIPWYFPFIIAVMSITLAYVIILVVLYFIHLLLPIIVIITAFVMFVLWLVGLVRSSIELWGPMGSVNDNCSRFVYRDGFWGGQTIDTLARIQQEGVCNLWQTGFAMQMIGTTFMLWLMLMAIQVMRARTIVYDA